jgi:hypothetical protein
VKLAKEDARRTILMGPEAYHRQIIAKHMPDADAEMTDQLIAHLKHEAETDPYALLQQLPSGKDGAQNLIFKGLNLEAALYVASLTGSIIHVDTEAHWEQLLKDAQPTEAPSQPTWEPVRQALGEISFPVELDIRRLAQRIANGDRPPIRALLRRLVESISTPGSGTTPAKLANQIRQVRGKVEQGWKNAGGNTSLPARLELHVPSVGFTRHEVQRLLVMFAGVTQPRLVPYALRLIFDEPEGSREDTT